MKAGWGCWGREGAFLAARVFFASPVFPRCASVFHGPTPNNCPCGSELRQDTPPPPDTRHSVRSTQGQGENYLPPPPFQSPPKTHPHTHPPLHLAARATTDPAARPERLPGDPTPSFLPSIRRGKARSPSPAHRDVHGSPHRAQRPCRPIPSSPGHPCPPRPPSTFPHPPSAPPPPLLCLPLFSFCFGPPLSRFPLFFFGSPVRPCVRAVGPRKEEGGEARPRNPPLPSPSFPPREGGPGPGTTRVVFCFVFCFCFPRRGGKGGKRKRKRLSGPRRPPPPPPPPPPFEEGRRSREKGGGRGC